MLTGGWRDDDLQVLPVVFAVFGFIRGASLGHHYGRGGALLGAVGGALLGYMLYFGLLAGGAWLLDRAGRAKAGSAEDEPGASGAVWPPAPKRGE
ncbi:MAG: hypothetical protein JO250_01775 [Armatimonadetes bacterium]|nr:hypothetical protein [Armatimonadota bacterium]